MLDNNTFMLGGQHDDREMSAARRRNMQRSRSPLKWEHDLFQDETKQQEETIAVIDNEDEYMKYRQEALLFVSDTGD